MPTINILKSLGNYTTDRVLAGVYGNLSDDGQSFRIAPEFAGFSTVFDGYCETDLSINDVSIMSLDVEDEAQAALLKLQIINGLRTRWVRMYDQNMASMNQASAIAFRGERNRIERASLAHMQQQAKSVWSVPVVATMTCEPYDDIRAPEELLEALSKITAIEVDPEAAPQRKDGASTTVIEPEEQADEAVMSEASGEIWRAFEQIEAKVAGAIDVVAGSEEEARAVIKMFAGLLDQLDGKFMIEMKKDRLISSVRLQQDQALVDAAPCDEDPEAGHDDRDLDDNIADHYSFQRG